VARKPLVGTVADNVQQFGTGALNIDGCRVACEGEKLPTGSGDRRGSMVYAQDIWTKGNMANGGNTTPPTGRWPANLIHDGSEEVLALFPQTKSGNLNGETVNADNSIYGKAGTTLNRHLMVRDGDSGSAARFFYCAKASRQDRDEGLEHSPEVIAPNFDQRPSGDFAKRMNRERPEVVRHNTHCTVKPTDLMRYLCRIVTPPGGIILDPYMGSGSTGKAAVLEGFMFIGIECEEAYCRIAAARIQAAIPTQEVLPLT